MLFIAARSIQRRKRASTSTNPFQVIFLVFFSFGGVTFFCSGLCCNNSDKKKTKTKENGKVVGSGRVRLRFNETAFGFPSNALLDLNAGETGGTLMFWIEVDRDHDLGANEWATLWLSKDHFGANGADGIELRVGGLSSSSDLELNVQLLVGGSNVILFHDALPIGEPTFVAAVLPRVDGSSSTNSLVLQVGEFKRSADPVNTPVIRPWQCTRSIRSGDFFCSNECFFFLNCC